MNDNILRAIESLCNDIATNTNAEDNQKRANAILALAFGGIFTPEEIEEDYTEDDSAAGAEKDKIKFPKPGEQFEYNGIKFTAIDAGYELYERTTAQGKPYIAVKSGFMLLGIISPYDLVNETFINNLDEILKLSRIALFNKQKDDSITDTNTQVKMEDMEV